MNETVLHEPKDAELLKIIIPETRSWILREVSRAYPPGIFKGIYHTLALMHGQQHSRTSDSVLLIANTAKNCKYIENFPGDIITFNEGFKKYKTPQNRRHLNVCADTPFWSKLRFDGFPQVEFYNFQFEFTNPNQVVGDHDKVWWDSGSLGLHLALAEGYKNLYLLGFGKTIKKRNNGVRYPDYQLDTFKRNQLHIIRRLGKECKIIRV